MTQKKWIVLLSILFCMSILTGCSKEETISNTSSLSSSSSPPISSADIKKDIAEEQQKQAAQSDGTVDIDLTVQSATMVFAEVSNISMKPKDYAGKTLKMHGKFSVFSNEGKHYFVILIKDAPGCCQQGISFILENGSQNPADYPAPDSDITVVGTLSTYSDGAATYCQMINAKIV